MILNIRRRKGALVTLGILALTFSVATAAVALDVASVEKARQDFFHSLGKPTKALNEELRNTTPDLAAVRGYIAAIKTAAPQLPAQFPAGSGPQAGLKTQALSAVWSDAARFKADNDTFQAAVVNLDKAGQTGDFDAIRAALKTTGESCKACHSTFRQEDH